MNEISFIIKYLPTKLRLNLFLVLFLSLANSILEVVGIGMLIPLFEIVRNFDNFSSYLVSNFNFLNFIKNFNQIEILKFSLIFFLLILFIKYLNYLYLNRIAINFSAKVKVFLSSRIFYFYSKKNYLFFKNKNSSLIIRDLLIEVTEFCDRFILSGLNLVIEFLIILFVAFFLLYKETTMVFILIIYLIPFCYLFFLFTKGKINKAASIRNQLDERKLFILKNYLNNIKVIKTQNKELFFLNSFKKYIANFEFSFANFNFIQIISRPFFEFVGLLFIFLWIIFSINSENNLEDIFLSFSILVAACIRVLPCINRVAYNWGQLQFSKPSRKIIIRELNNTEEINESNFLYKKNTLTFNEIYLKNISFKYPNQNNGLNIFSDLNLEIRKGEKICLLGESGSGKTTLIEIISGLIKPTNGSIIIDKNYIFDSTKERFNLTYIPQELVLMDGSVANNICLGEKVNQKKLKEALKLSLAENFLNNELSFSDEVGEAGKKFSGGQRQRINLARSFYENSDFVVFDESVNAIDQKMKLILIENIFSYFEKKTIIFALHDKSFLQKFDKVYELKNGQLQKL